MPHRDGLAAWRAGQTAPASTASAIQATASTRSCFALVRAASVMVANGAFYCMVSKPSRARRAKMLWGGRRGLSNIDAAKQPMECPMSDVDDLSRSLTVLDQDTTLIAVIEMSLKSWLVAGIVPGVSRAPLKKLEADEDGVLRLLHRWRAEAARAGRHITRMVVAFEAGRDGFWLARWLRVRGIETDGIHAVSVAVSRKHRRAKTDRLDTEMLKRALLGWLRGEPRHCQMAAV